MWQDPFTLYTELFYLCGIPCGFLNEKLIRCSCSRLKRKLKKVRFYYNLNSVNTGFFFFNITTGRASFVSNSIYKKTDDQLYAMIHRAYTFLMKIVVPLYVLPPIMLTIFKYGSSNVSKDAYTQMYPAT